MRRTLRSKFEGLLQSIVESFGLFGGHLAIVSHIDEGRMCWDTQAQSDLKRTCDGRNTTVCRKGKPEKDFYIRGSPEGASLSTELERSTLFKIGTIDGSNAISETTQSNVSIRAFVGTTLSM